MSCDLSLEASIPQKVLKTFLQTLSATDEIRLSSKDGNLVFATPSGDTELAGLATEDRPEIPDLGEVLASAKVEEGFTSIFTEVAVAASTDESRQVLTGVLMEAGDGAVQLTATDSYRLHHDKVPGSFQAEARSIVPPRYLKALAGTDPLLFEFGEEHVRFTEGSVTVTIRRIEGEFPVECTNCQGPSASDAALSPQWVRSACLYRCIDAGFWDRSDRRTSSSLMVHRPYLGRGRHVIRWARSHTLRRPESTRSKRAAVVGMEDRSSDSSGCLSVPARKT